MSRERGLTAGNVGAYATANAVEWGLCKCGAGSETDEVPLFKHDDGLRCSTCCKEDDEIQSQIDHEGFK